MHIYRLFLYGNGFPLFTSIILIPLIRCTPPTNAIKSKHILWLLYPSINYNFILFIPTILIAFISISSNLITNSNDGTYNPNSISNSTLVMISLGIALGLISLMFTGCNLTRHVFWVPEYIPQVPHCKYIDPNFKSYSVVSSYDLDMIYFSAGG